MTLSLSLPSASGTYIPFFNDDNCHDCFLSFFPPPSAVVTFCSLLYHRRPSSLLSCWCLHLRHVTVIIMQPLLCPPSITRHLLFLTLPLPTPAPLPPPHPLASSSSISFPTSPSLPFLPPSLPHPPVGPGSVIEHNAYHKC